MFNGCSSLEILDLSNFNTRFISKNDSVFEGLNALSYLNLYNYRGRDMFISLNPIKNLQICTKNASLTEAFRFLKIKILAQYVYLKKKQVKPINIEATKIDKISDKVSESVLLTDLRDDKSSEKINGISTELTDDEILNSEKLSDKLTDTSDKITESSDITTDNYDKSTQSSDKITDTSDITTDITNKIKDISDKTLAISDKSTEISDKSTATSHKFADIPDLLIQTSNES